jgi:opacity protein-like surface antigen
MKKTILLSFLFLFISSGIYSQHLKPRNMNNEVSLSYGIGSKQQAASEIGTALFSILDFSMDKTNIDNVAGPVIIRYSNNLSRNMNFGLGLSYTGIGLSDKNTDSPAGITKYNVKFYTMLANVNFIYNPDNMIKLYSGAGGGMTFASSDITTPEKTETNNTQTFAYHLNALGIRIGKNVAGFIELGYGYNGIINGGVSLKF